MVGSFWKPVTLTIASGMGSDMIHGELAYKDIHGRVWHIQQRDAFMWTAETLDVGHTIRPHQADMKLDMLLASIDREGFATDERSTLPIESGATGSEKPATGRESEPERIEEIRINASQIDG